MNIATKKWIFLKISSLILIPLMFWFILNFVSIYDKSFEEILIFFSNSNSRFLFSLFIIFVFFFSSLSISEVFEDYISENNYEMINLFLNSLAGKFIILGITWSFSFQILSEIRHLVMDFGYGFELNTSKITGLIVILGSIILTVVFYLIGKNFI